MQLSILKKSTKFLLKIKRQSLHPCCGNANGGTPLRKRFNRAPSGPNLMPIIEWGGGKVLPRTHVYPDGHSLLTRHTSIDAWEQCNHTRKTELNRYLVHALEQPPIS